MNNIKELAAEAKRLADEMADLDALYQDRKRKPLHAAIDALAAAQAAPVADGWKLVPEEPTRDMVAAACAKHGYPGGSRQAYVDGYCAMIAAAPPAPAPVELASETLDMPEDDTAHEAWVSACESDGIKHSGSAFERGWELALSNGVPEWPTWANQVLEAVREHSGYDGYDDADGVDIVEETRECLRELAAQVDRASAAHAARPATALVEPENSQFDFLSDVYGQCCEAIKPLVDRGVLPGSVVESLQMLVTEKMAKPASPAPVAMPEFSPRTTWISIVEARMRDALWQAQVDALTKTLERVQELADSHSNECEKWAAMHARDKSSIEALTRKRAELTSACEFYEAQIARLCTELAALRAAPTGTQPLLDALIRAVISCSHSIDSNQVVLHFDANELGHNALNQLHRRICNVVNEHARHAPTGAQPLTEGQITDCVAGLDTYPLELVQVPHAQVLAFARAIEHAHGITGNPAADGEVTR